MANPVKGVVVLDLNYMVQAKFTPIQFLILAMLSSEFKYNFSDMALMVNLTIDNFELEINGLAALGWVVKDKELPRAKKADQYYKFFQ